MAFASASRRPRISAADAPACTAAAKVRFIRSIAQNRLTAVGRVPAIRSQVFWNSAANWRVPVALLRRIARAMPIAAATPMAGAPRMTMVLMPWRRRWRTADNPGGMALADPPNDRIGCRFLSGGIPWGGPLRAGGQLRRLAAN
jgi:hypothetical protein